MIRDTRSATSQESRQPPNNISREVKVGKTVEKQCVADRVEGFGEISGANDCAEGRLVLVKTSCDACGEWNQSGSGGAPRGKTMLGGEAG